MLIKFAVILILAATCYLLPFFGLVTPFLITFTVFYLTLFFVLFVSIVRLILPTSIKNKVKSHSVSFHLTIFIAIVLFYFGTIPFKNFNESMTVNLLLKAGMFLLITFSTYTFLKRGWSKTTLVLGLTYLIFLLVSTVASSILSGSKILGTEDSLDSLDDLGYVGFVSAENNKNKKPVTVYNLALMDKSPALYTYRDQGEAFLINTDGKIINKWNLNPEGKHRKPWPYADLCKNGDLLTFCNNSVFKRIDKKSRLIWSYPLRAHHHFFVDEKTQNIYVLAQRDSVIYCHGIPLPIIEDYIAVLSENGKLIREIKLIDAIKNHIHFRSIIDIYSHLLKPANIIEIIRKKLTKPYAFTNASVFDVVHSNSIQLLDRDIKGLCAKNDILISMRDLNLAAIFNTEKNRFVWTWGPGQVSGQHHATLLNNKNILIFDNGPDRGYSRIVELDPLTLQIQWQYTAEPKENFYSETRGSCQRLSNGNTCITESDRARAFEITKDGQIIWEFYNPDINEATQKRQAVYRVVRIENPNVVLSASKSQPIK